MQRSGRRRRGVDQAWRDIAVEATDYLVEDDIPISGATVIGVATIPRRGGRFAFNYSGLFESSGSGAGTISLEYDFPGSGSGLLWFTIPSAAAITGGVAWGANNTTSKATPIAVTANVTANVSYPIEARGFVLASMSNDEQEFELSMSESIAGTVVALAGARFTFEEMT